MRSSRVSRANFGSCPQTELKLNPEADDGRCRSGEEITLDEVEPIAI